ncbi:hypothetical protein NST04_28740 [Paenibacillus sp. FSL H7-0756]|uniref:hypothetical protein n=1 Tax=Paenibacillus sp. FSL H7-0756 TaxID=2954738 RepID=UPI0030F86BEA
MSYINFKGTVKKINLKSAEETEITISIPAAELDGQYNTLQSMLELKVIGGLDSQIVTYKVLKNAKTGKPLTKYTVDGSGVVSAAEPEGEQLSMDLGLPAEQIEVKADPEQIDLGVIQDFILSGLAPRFDDMDYDFHEITERLVSGDTYLKIAADIGMGVGVFVVMVDDYRKRVAPMAAKWNEWRKGQAPVAPPTVEPAAEDADQTEGETESEQSGGEGDNAELEPKQPDGDGQSGSSDPEEAKGTPVADGQTGGGTGEEPDATETSPGEEVSKDDLEAFILTNRPVYDDIEINGTPILFPELLQERLEKNKTWKEIAQEKEVSASVLSAKWGAYKKRVERKMMKGDGGAA